MKKIEGSPKNLNNYYKIQNIRFTTTSVNICGSVST